MVVRTKWTARANGSGRAGVRDGTRLIFPASPQGGAKFSPGERPPCRARQRQTKARPTGKLRHRKNTRNRTNAVNAVKWP